MFDSFKLDRIPVGTWSYGYGMAVPARPWSCCTGILGPTRRGIESHRSWRGTFTVVCPDLRGYGESTTTPDQPDHRQASKSAMASDIAELMDILGHGSFAVVGHDRGAYVAFAPPWTTRTVRRIW